MADIIIPALVAVGDVVEAEQYNSVVTALEVLAGESAGSSTGSTPPNPSFEQEGGGGPTFAAGWTFTPGAGGIIERVETSSVGGAWQLQMTRGGVGGDNAGGSVSGDFEIVPGRRLDTFWYRSDADIDSTVYLDVLNSAKATIQTLELASFSGQIAPLFVDIGANDNYIAPRGDGRFGRIRIEGAKASSVAAGSAFFDGFGSKGGENNFPDIGEFSTLSASATTVATVDVLVGATTGTVSVTIQGKKDSPAGWVNLKYGATIGADIILDNSYANVTPSIDIPSPGYEIGLITIEIQVRASAGESFVLIAKTIQNGHEQNIVVSVP
jgi:hypothetical protein